MDRAIVVRRPKRSARWPATAPAAIPPAPNAATAPPAWGMEKPRLVRYRARKMMANDANQLMKLPVTRIQAGLGNSRMLRRIVRRSVPSAIDPPTEQTTPRLFGIDTGFRGRWADHAGGRGPSGALRGVRRPP